MIRKTIISLILAAALLSHSQSQSQQSPNAKPESKASAQKDRGLVFGMIPVVGVEATKERFARLTRHMSEQLGVPVSLVVTETYGELIEKMVAGEIDLVKFSPLAYVRARQLIPELRLIASHVANGSIDYSSYIVSVQGNAHNSLKSLKGAKICFADPNSTSGYLYPLALLQKLGLDLERDFGEITFGGNHRACLEGLLSGRWDLAATWSGAIREARFTSLDLGELVIVAKAGRIPYDAYCLSPSIDQVLAQRVQALLLNTNTLTKEGRLILSSTLGINGWVPITDSVYDGIRRVEEQLNRDGEP